MTYFLHFLLNIDECVAPRILIALFFPIVGILVAAVAWSVIGSSTSLGTTGSSLCTATVPLLQRPIHLCNGCGYKFKADINSAAMTVKRIDGEQDSRYGWDNDNTDISFRVYLKIELCFSFESKNVSFFF